MEKPRPGAIERALQLAATGHFRTMTQIKLVLRNERYTALDAQFDGGGIRRQLKQVMRAAAATDRAAASERGADSTLSR